MRTILQNDWTGPTLPPARHHSVSCRSPPGTSVLYSKKSGQGDVEHAYTYKAPAAKSLTASFLDYLRSTQARPVLDRGDLVPCSDLPAGFCG